MVARFLEKEGKENLPHVFEWLEEVIAVEEAEGEDQRAKSVLAPPSRWQRGCPEVIPGLRAHCFWREKDKDGLPLLSEAVAALESSFEEIKAELLALRGQCIFQPYRAPGWAHGRQVGAASTNNSAPSTKQDGSTKADNDSASSENTSSTSTVKEGTDSGRWSICYLELHGADEAACKSNLALCPQTAAALAKIPRRYGHTLFSSLAPGSHITTHTGPTNKKLRLHLPLIVPSASPADAATTATPATPHRPPCRIRVGPEIEAWQEGKVLILDDSHQHEAWNDHPAGNRVVLIVDVWHPDLTDKEVKVLELIRNAQLRAAKAMGETLAAAAAAAATTTPSTAAEASASKEAAAGSGSDFFSVLRKGREEGSGGAEAAASGSGALSGEDVYVFGPLENAPCKDD